MTKERYDELATEWLAATRVANDPVDREECARANDRLEEIERLMDAAPWEYDGDGNLVGRAVVGIGECKP